MIDVSSFSITLALVLSGYGAVALVVGHRMGRAGLFRSGTRAVLVQAFFLTLASAGMEYAFLSRDFSIKYVASYSDRSLPLFYTISAFWAGQEGSLLLWAWVLSIFSVIVIRQSRHKNRELLPYILAVLMGISFFFNLIMAFVSPPFARLPVPPADGQGLNPLLRNPGMVFHPTTLYLGYVGFSVPFAFAMAALLTGRLDDTWIKSTRRWTLFAWFFLTLGNLFGAQWAYVTLGWGGFWAWDPVENASFMPWLTATAYLHSVMIQEKKNMLKVWNMVLIIVTFLLTIFGTFITRSGIISSVHTFAQSSLGPFFLVFLGLTLVFSLYLLFVNLDNLRSENELDSFISRESSFLFNNLILVGAAFATFWGTVFPMISEAVRGVKITVGPPFFNQVNIPIGITLLLLTGICPLIAWRKASWVNLRKNFLITLLAAAGTAVFLYAMGVRHPWALVAFSLSGFVIYTIFQEFYRGARARGRMMGESPPKALWSLVAKNPRRYGGYVIHIGMVLIFLGITGEGAYKKETLASLRPGEKLSIGRYAVKYEGLSYLEVPGRFTVRANLSVSNAGGETVLLKPEKRYHRNSDQPHSQVSFHSTLREDLYAILVGHDKDGTASLKILINPLVVWLWIGGAVMGLGTLIVMWPEREKAAARYSVNLVEGRGRRT